MSSFSAAREGRACRFSPSADPHTLLRRVSLDLTGLPPTPEEVRAFIADETPEAYERVVDRLLASPAYGERWAKMWLDLARYADSTGYGSDKFRLNIWPYRDWVINAFNRNLPYDQFTIEQLAGDLLPERHAGADRGHGLSPQHDDQRRRRDDRRGVSRRGGEGSRGDHDAGLDGAHRAAARSATRTNSIPISQREYYALLRSSIRPRTADREDEAPRMPLPTAAGGRTTRAPQGRDRRAGGEDKLKSTPELEAEQHEWEAQMHSPVAWAPLEILEAKSAQR